MWEESRDFHKAIDRYLEISEQMFPPDHLEQIWNNCFNIAMNYAKDRIQGVVPALTSRLMKINKFESAAYIFEESGYFEKAIDCFIQSQKFERAMECARQVRPVEM